MDYDSAAKSFKTTLGELVAADTTSPPGNEAKAAAIIAKRLKDAKIPYEIVEFGPGRSNIVARLKGDGSAGKPLLLLAHLDVVGTANQNWTFKPHEMTEKDGFYYGRGVVDDLGMAVVNTEILIAVKKSGVPLKRDLILALTGDEESGGAGIQYLIKNRPELVNAGIAINEGGDLVIDKDGKMRYVGMNAAEKTYQDFTLSAKGPSGHSSMPKPGNAIYKLAKALEKFGSGYHPKERLLPVTRAFFKERASVEPPDVAAAMRAVADAKGTLPKKALDVLEKNPAVGNKFFTTCVATTLSGGTRVNALPPLATANINCRILPDETAADVEKKIRAIINDPEIEIAKDNEFPPSPASPVANEVVDAIKHISGEMWPGVPVIPGMASGATDSRSLRAIGVAAYGIDPFPITEDDYTRMHGIDERLSIASARTGLEFEYRVVSSLIY